MQLDYVGRSPIRPHDDHDDVDAAMIPETDTISKIDKSIEKQKIHSIPPVPMKSGG